ncbi:MAG TPA: bifunctional UDP-N-acetylglucosamine diphosphorylase/glucosamine-1-phosphate N-acetyltransferase GlmU [Myxococcales bacterium]|nr:bifunctional UDP-N-acetylglucosamine diphosphorylase/glucosamine-1-phosphate N-acetyltransferase GlmU [Myxococcales bacterium]
MASLGAIVLAAGKGTRMKSDRPKVLHEIAGRPLVAFPLALAAEVGAKPVVVVLGNGAEAVRTVIAALPACAETRFAHQADQRGTAHAVLSARDELRAFRGTLLVLYGDVPLLQAATVRRLLDAPAAPLAFLTSRPLDPTGYGRVVRDVEGRVCRIVEQRDCRESEAALREVNAGIYRVDAAFLWSALDAIGSGNAQGEFYLTDMVELAARKGGAVAVEAPFEETAGVNDRIELASADARLRQRINARHQLAGVTLVAPETTFIDESVSIAADAIIEPGCVLTGRTRIGARVRLRAYSVLEDAEVGEGAIVGPFARLRPGTVLGADVHVGNFVEIKKSRLGAGTKANHLSYLGDAEIGSGVNVGAGTITCNYDGVDKHPTVLGDGVFIGSDTQLVAPVTVGKGAYVGAGSTVTEDVPPDALALSRVPQKNIEGWAAERRRARTGAKPGKKRKVARSA